MSDFNSYGGSEKSHYWVAFLEVYDNEAALSQCHASQCKNDKNYRQTLFLKIINSISLTKEVVVAVVFDCNRL